MPCMFLLSSALFESFFKQGGQTTVRYGFLWVPRKLRANKFTLPSHTIVAISEKMKKIIYKTFLINVQNLGSPRFREENGDFGR